jgi:sodium/potassium/calcium exchanger 2
MEPSKSANRGIYSVDPSSRRLQYPDDPLIDQPYGEASNQYLIVIHIVFIGYMLLGLNTVCDVYFTGSLEVMVDKWKIKPDVAGATFMAAGGSAPELFTSLIGATITVNDVGFGTIVGSAVFNVLFVIGCCGYVSEKPIKLTWWPLFRDCTYYIFGLTLLAVCAKSDGAIQLWEAIVLHIAYIIYCTIMYFNDKAEAFINSLVRSSGAVKTSQVVPEPQIESQEKEISTSCEAEDRLRAGGAGDAPSALDTIPSVAPLIGAKALVVVDENATGNTLEEPPETKVEIPEEPGRDETGGGNDGEKEGGEDAEEEEEDPIEGLILRDAGRSDTDQILWYFSLPIYVPLYYLIPKPTEQCFMCTFACALMWIAGFSFFLVWWVEVLGAVMGIPTIVMGFTLLAAGTSIPDLVSSVAVAKMGEGDMAVSSSIGSNIFDILVGLPIPWIIKILVVEQLVNDNSGHVVVIKSPYIAFYVLLLLFMVLCVIVSIHMLGWYLNQTLGAIMAGLYAIFLIIALTVESQQPVELQL